MYKVMGDFFFPVIGRFWWRHDIREMQEPKLEHRAPVLANTRSSSF